MSVLLQACKITQTAPENGWIKSRTGLHDCASGQTCIIIPVDGEGFSDTFTAVPGEGYVFSGWVK